MCGYAIEWNPANNWSAIKHRGVKHSQIKIDLKINPGSSLLATHFKLPFQTELNDEFGQPIKMANGNYLLFNGEIFNIPSKYKNDVEYLSDFFGGSGWVNKIGGPEYNTWDGFWSIAIITGEGIYCFTDPLGQKQLYYSEGGIASEMKALMEPKSSQAYNRTFDHRMPSSRSLTPFEGIFRILPNLLHYFSFSGPHQFVANILYNDPLFKLRIPSNLIDHNPKYLKELLTESVRIRINGDRGKVSSLEYNPRNTLFLSGGLDSSIILSIIIELGLKEHFEFITLENGKDSEYITLLEDHFGIKVRRVFSGSWDELSSEKKKEILYHYESPIELGSLLPNYYLAGQAESRSILTGDGADELFSGYKRAQETDTQNYDVFTELPYYHNIRLDRMGMMFTKEVRCPFMGHDVLRFALSCPYELRKGKQILKEAFPNLPDPILNRKKEPLRVNDMRWAKAPYQDEIFKTFLKTFNLY